VRLIRAAYFWLIIALCGGCAGSLEASRHELGAAPASSAERCASLDNTRRTWGGVAKASAVLAGGAGVSTIPATDNKLETGLAISSVVVGAVAAAAVYVSEDAGNSWARECAGR
jgi:hypothetical protein